MQHIWTVIIPFQLLEEAHVQLRGTQVLQGSSVMDLGINQAGSWMKLLNCRILVSLASQE